jgi:hypothetical protein
MKLRSSKAENRCLIVSFVCFQVGAPPDVVSELDELSQKCHAQQCVATISIGADPELDQFMVIFLNLDSLCGSSLSVFQVLKDNNNLLRCDLVGLDVL